MVSIKPSTKTKTSHIKSINKALDAPLEYKKKPISMEDVYDFYEDNRDKDKYFHDLDELNAYDTAIAKYVWILSWTKTGKMEDHYHASAVVRFQNGKKNIYSF
jgi:hypothetical protein